MSAASFLKVGVNLVTVVMKKEVLEAVSCRGLHVSCGDKINGVCW